MSDSWLEIEDEALDAREVQRRVEERLTLREAEEGETCSDQAMDLSHLPSGPLSVSDRSETIGRWEQDCDLVPAHYTINWRVPIVGQVHAIVRRVINAEIRRFLLPSLVKQSHLNRVMLQLLRQLDQENARLRQEVERLGRAVDSDPGGQEQDC